MQKAIPAAALAAVFLPAVAVAQTPDDSGARLILETRLRGEIVDQSSFAEQAQALTLRTRLGWRSPTVRSFQLLVEGEGVVVLDDRYSAPRDPDPLRPAVGDGEDLELNRLQLRWTGLPRTELVAGRQRMSLANQRFLGGSAWRQNEQTFDGVRVTTRAFEPLTLTAGHAEAVRRPPGRKHAQGVWHGGVQFAEVAAPTPAGTLTAYGLAADLDEAPMQSAATWGVRLAGSRPIAGELSASWTFDVARQTDHGDNPNAFDLGYDLVALGVQTPRGSLQLARERLGGDGTTGLQTGLGSAHGFQGWSDVVMATPAFGLQDLYLRGQTTVTPAGWRPVKLTAEAHRFSDRADSFEVGREVDLSAATAVGAHWTVEAKAARFEGERPGFPDTTKAWLIVDYRY